MGIIAFQKIDEMRVYYKRRKEEEEAERRQARSKLIIVGE